MSNGPKQNNNKRSQSILDAKDNSYRWHKSFSQETVLNCFSKVQIQLKFQIQFSWPITFRLRERRISRNVRYSILCCGGQSVLLWSKCCYSGFSSEEHQIPHPPLPPIFYTVFPQYPRLTGYCEYRISSIYRCNSCWKCHIWRNSRNVGHEMHFMCSKR